MSKKRKFKDRENYLYLDNLLWSKLFQHSDMHSYVRLGDNIPSQNQLIVREDSGVFFGMKRELGSDYFVGKHQGDDGHILFVGGPGSCKTSGPVLMSLGTWDGRIIAMDIKGEGGDLVNPWFDFNRRKGKHLKIFNPTKEYCSRYNPYDFLKLDGEDNLIQNARDLALAILPTPPNVNENRVWIKLAQNLLTGVILYYYGIGATFNQTMLAVQNYSVEELVRKILGSDDENAKLELTHNKEISAKMFISKLQDLKPEILAGVGMDFGEFVALAVDPFIRLAFCTEGATDVISWRDFNSNEKVYDVILQIPESKLEQWEAMTTLMLNQLIKTLELRADKHSTFGKELQSILILLDEFPRLGTCHAIKNGLATLRSRGVTFALFIQNLAQLDERYGVNGRRDILGCCSYKGLLGVTEPDDQEYFSRLIGAIKTGQRSISANFTSDDELLGYSINICEARERIIEPEELGVLEKDYVLITPRGFCRVDKVSFYDKRCRALFIPPLLPPLTMETFGYGYKP
ncbi:MAG: type IV secretory system conjugative DNA transfer family protein [Lachnospiraceae bacterium]|nr:type IV secretory system conjugative DNA transfer family protein [Lachnospiraceae bacterium]